MPLSCCQLSCEIDRCPIPPPPPELLIVSTFHYFPLPAVLDEYITSQLSQQRKNFITSNSKTAPGGSRGTSVCDAVSRALEHIFTANLMIFSQEHMHFYALTVS